MSLVHDLRMEIQRVQEPDSKEGNLFYNKYKFKNFLSKNGIRTPETYAFITDEDQIQLIRDLESFIIKPNMASSGFNVYSLTKIGPSKYKEIDGRIHGWGFIEGKIKNILSLKRHGGVLIEEVINNPPELDKFKSAPGIIDLRLYMLDDKILYGKLRIPNKKSEGYANTGRKATAMFITSEGIIAQDNIFRNTTTIHPDINKDFKGLFLDFWYEFSYTARNVSKLFKLKFHSVDITIDSNDKGCVIESEKIPYVGHVTDHGCIDLINKLKKIT